MEEKKDLCDLTKVFWKRLDIRAQIRVPLNYYKLEYFLPLFAFKFVNTDIGYKFRAIFSFIFFLSFQTFSFLMQKQALFSFMAGSCFISYAAVMNKHCTI